MLKAWAQLVRLPNVFTAPADVIAGAALGVSLPDERVLPGNIVLLILISLCYYAGGMILNDVADVEVDQRERPNRPLPSGRIAIRHATLAGFGLLLTGLCIGLSQIPENKSIWECWPLFGLPLLIIDYNFFQKDTWAGPLVMGLCRGCNLLLGTLMLADVKVTCYLGAVIATLYITGITVIAYDETRQLRRWRLNLGLCLMFASTFLLMLEPSMFWFKGAPEYLQYVPIFVVLFIVLLLYLWMTASKNPTSPMIGRAIKYSILGIIVIDSIHAFLGLGYPGLLVLLFLVPALYLGRFIYST